MRIAHTEAHVLDDLWASTLDGIGFDLRHREVTLEGHAVDHGVRTQFTLLAMGLTRFEYGVQTPAPWNYAELTEAHLQIDDEGVELKLVLWEESNSLRVRCAGLLRDGILIAGSDDGEQAN